MILKSPSYGTTFSDNVSLFLIIVNFPMIPKEPASHSHFRWLGVFLIVVTICLTLLGFNVRNHACRLILSYHWLWWIFPWFWTNQNCAATYPDNSSFTRYYEFSYDFVRAKIMELYGLVSSIFIFLIFVIFSTKIIEPYTLAYFESILSLLFAFWNHGTIHVDNVFQRCVWYGRYVGSILWLPSDDVNIYASAETMWVKKITCWMTEVGIADVTVYVRWSTQPGTFSGALPTS